MPHDVRYRLLSAEVIGFQERFVDADEGSAFHYEHGLTLRFVPDLTLLAVGVALRLNHVRDGEQTCAAEIEFGCSFEVEPATPLPEGEPWALPRPLVASLLGVALSTARGALIGSSRRPYASESPFPIVSPMALLDDLAAAESMPWLAPEDGGAAPALPPARPTRARKKAE